MAWIWVHTLQRFSGLELPLHLAQYATLLPSLLPLLKGYYPFFRHRAAGPRQLAHRCLAVA